MKEHHQLNGHILIQLAALGCDALTCTANRRIFHPEVLKVARRERTALNNLDGLNEEKKEEAVQPIRKLNTPWIESLIALWMEVRP
ncbi:hypothetical protein H9L39_19151 [Fusarium oxysporum f. sp. albedinis]|nr:hypothetical protein H9L39_19151 [Fusarium oxysporum f. sp. albedinis]